MLCQFVSTNSFFDRHKKVEIEKLATQLGTKIEKKKRTKRFEFFHCFHLFALNLQCEQKEQKATPTLNEFRSRNKTEQQQQQKKRFTGNSTPEAKRRETKPDPNMDSSRVEKKFEFKAVGVNDVDDDDER